MIKNSKVNGFIVYDRPATKTVTPQQLVNLLIKNQTNKSKLLKQLQQLRIDIEEVKNLSLHQIYNQFQCVFKNTYSLKYLGLNQNQIGMISRRVDPLQYQNFIVQPSQQSKFTVNKYFYPKPLKVGKKKPSQPKLEAQNLQQLIKADFQKRQALKRQKTQKIKNFQQQNRKTLSGSWINSKNRIKTANPLFNQGFREKIQRITLNTKCSKEQSLNQSRYQNYDFPIDHSESRKQAKSFSRKLSKGVLPR